MEGSTVCTHTMECHVYPLILQLGEAEISSIHVKYTDMASSNCCTHWAMSTVTDYD